MQKKLKNKKNFFYWPYKKLKNLEKMQNDILEKIKNGKATEAKKDIRNLANLILKGANYLQKYDSTFISISAAISYILWMFYLFTYISMNTDPNINYTFLLNKSNCSSFIFALFITIILTLYLFLQKCPFKYYFYMLFPCYFGWRVFSEKKYLIKFLDYNSFSKETFFKIFYQICTIIASISLVSILNI